MTVLLLVDDDPELTRQTLGFARSLGDVEGFSASPGDLPVERLHVAEGLGAYAPGAWASAVEEVIDRVQP
jgi:hypothetical protein